MMNFSGKQLRDEFSTAFGLDIASLTPTQLNWLVKFSKHVRGRCRSNAAFNNYMNASFAPAKFLEVPKEWNGKQYKGLKITAANGTVAEDKEDEE